MKRDRTLNLRRLPEPTFLPKRMTVRSNGQYKPEYDKQVYYLALLGATDVQMAQVFGVNPLTIDRWKEKHPEFGEALRRGKVEADAKVAHSMYQAAVGYKHPDTVVLTNRRKKYNDEGKVIEEWTEPLLVSVMKYYPPNGVIGLKWLAARQPEKWGDKLQVDAKLSITHQLDLSDFSLEELELLGKLGVARFDNNTQNIEEAKYAE